MKKVYLLLAAIAFSFAGVAQNYSAHKVFSKNIDNVKFEKAQELQNLELGNVDYSPVVLRRGMGDERNYFNFAESYFDYMAGSGAFYYAQTFPEMLKVKYEDNDNPGTYIYDTARYASFGASFEPTGFIYETAGEPILQRNQNYRLDTLVFYYWYERRIQDPSIVDTIIIDIFNRDQVLNFYHKDTKAPLFGTVRFNPATSRGVTPQVTIKEELTQEDTAYIAHRGSRGLVVPLTNFGVDSNTIAVTFTFKPGYAYSADDTLNGELDPSIVNKQMNQFYFLYLSDEGYHDNDPLNDYNAGLFAFKFSNWTTNYWNYVTSSGHLPLYIPNYFFSRYGFPYVTWAISWDPDWKDPASVDEMANGVKVKDIYPNPVVNNAKLDINLTKSENIRVELMNALGQYVATVVDEDFSAGEHSIDINTNGLKAGYYICKVSAGNASVTKTILVK